MTLLVAYASRHGATEGIAEFIAVRLAERGIATDVRRVDAVDGLDDYDAIVFGAPVYDQRWPDEAREFAARFAELLAARPFGLVSVGSFGDTQPLVGRFAHKEPEDIDALRAALHPRDYRVFRGVIRNDQWPWWSGLVFHLFGGRFGDRRDWDVIAAWAEHIARELEGVQSALG
jgi:menaquinone-dependent protoporphyrinogen oxidase